MYSKYNTSIYIKLFRYACLFVCLCPSSTLSSSQIWLIFGVQGLWVNKKDMGYARLHYEAVLRLKSRSNVALHRS